MIQATPLLTLPIEGDKAVTQAIQSLNWAGMQVLRSFDLKMARSVHIDCACPHHGTEQCDCQMVVLLIYYQEHPPATLVAHSHHGQTQFALVDTPHQHPHPDLQDTLHKVLRSENFVPLSKEVEANAT